MNQIIESDTNTLEEWNSLDEIVITKNLSSEKKEEDSEPEFEKDYFIVAEQISELPNFVDSEKYSLIDPSTTGFRHTLEIKGEEFVVDFEDDKCFITHPSWSLCGEGPNLLSAELDLLSEAKEILNVVKDESNSDLSIESIRMRDFLYRLV